MPNDSCDADRSYLLFNRRALLPKQHEGAKLDSNKMPLFAL